jgi:phage-related protein
MCASRQVPNQSGGRIRCESGSISSRFYALSPYLRVLQKCYKGVTRVLQGVTRVVTGIVKRVVTSVLQGCYKCVAKVLQGCNKCVAKVLQGCNKGCHKGVTRMLHVARVLQGCYKGVTRVLHAFERTSARQVITLVVIRVHCDGGSL